METRSPEIAARPPAALASPPEVYIYVECNTCMVLRLMWPVYSRLGNR